MRTVRRALPGGGGAGFGYPEAHPPAHGRPRHGPADLAGNKRLIADALRLGQEWQL